MSVTPVTLFGPTVLTNSAAAMFTAGANSRYVVLRVTAVNRDTVSRLLSVHVVRSGGSATASNLVLDEHSISANEDIVVDSLSGLVLGAGDAIWAFDDAGSVVNLTGSGYQTR